MAANTLLDRLVGLAMLILASAVFLYYTIWTLLMVYLKSKPLHSSIFNIVQPFVDDSHPVQSLFPPRVWAIRIPVILLLLGGAVVGSFLSVIMIRSNRKKALKAKKAAEAQKAK
ncbi:dolichol phosphate-mannose biosynthesis regulatory [Lecanosticta acicola]|uniref:Dolichol phosphate-mannose biosynthesis regulatory protein n=1 Tax=Lecanosticta acicola TaxID=111012 RepID=A0AAI8Z194_9PEZI|nr:dolichol phosphate-mannose biosynthesis regulatory [Lecanosticta acicola]